ncbi:HD domain-containing protein [Nakamurella sp. GG22]
MAKSTANQPGPITSTAERVARYAHQGRFDRIGAPYIDHPERVSRRLTSRGYCDEVVAAGWLHGVLQDTNWTVRSLRAAGITGDTLALVEVMTRRHGQRDADYYAGLVDAGPAAVAVKLADIEDSADSDRAAVLDQGDRERLARRYKTARKLLLAHQPTELPLHGET